MGACNARITPQDGVRSRGNVRHKKAAKKIDDVMRDQSARDAAEVKLLLLGGGESGKTTFRKQMRIIHNESGFSQEEKDEWKIVIYGNIIDGINALVRGISKMGNERLTPELQEYANELELFSVEDEELSTFNEQLAERLKMIWDCPLIQQVYQRRSELSLGEVGLSLDSCAYFIQEIDRLFSTDYIPINDDVLRARIQTTDVQEEEFEYLKTKFRVIDVGGQRNERKKWLPLFEEVTAFMFFASLADYDETLAEDRTENRMHESLQIFGAIANYHYSRTPPPILLFLNKNDIFREKILRVDLKFCFPEYDGGCNYDNALKFIKDRFIEQNHGRRKIYPFVTTATNTDNIKFVFNACSDIILKENLRGSGMYNGGGVMIGAY